MRKPTRAALLASLLCYSTLSTTQEIDFQNSIDASAETLILLDVMASDCLSALDSATDSQPPCDDFMAAVDGELLAQYLAQCRILKNWRNDYVSQFVASAAEPENDGNEEMLRRLVAIEYYCGEDAVVERTEFVATAFNRLAASTGVDSTLSGTSASAISRQLSESRFDALERSERQRLQDAVQNQQNQSQRENQRQFDALENELIRQQIRNANRNN